MNTTQQKVTLHVQGMTCRSCALHVERALCEVAGVEAVTVNLAAKAVIVEGSGFATQNLLAAVRVAGYTGSL